MTKENYHSSDVDNIYDDCAPIIPVSNRTDEENISPPSVYRGLRWLYWLEDKLAFVMRVIMFVTMLALGLLMFSQVVMRYGVASPFLGTEELAPMLALWVYFMGMSYCTRERDHIEGGVMSLVIKQKNILLSLRLLGTVVSLVALCIFTYYAWEFASFNLSINRKSPYMRLPKYLWDFSMLSGFVLMTFYLTLQAFIELRELLFSKTSESPK